jgi:hypothetical protein
MKLQKNEKTGQYFMNLPKAIIEAKKWQKGQELKIRFNERGNIELEEVR